MPCVHVLLLIPKDWHELLLDFARTVALPPTASLVKVTQPRFQAALVLGRC
jgi:hypothetical protein